MMEHEIKEVWKWDIKNGECKRMQKHKNGKEKQVNVLSDRKNVLSLQQHAYPASRKNSALRVSFLFLYTHDNE